MTRKAFSLLPMSPPFLPPFLPRGYVPVLIAADGADAADDETLGDGVTYRGGKEGGRVGGRESAERTKEGGTEGGRKGGGDTHLQMPASGKCRS